MKKKISSLHVAAAALAAFVLWTAAVWFVDVRAVGSGASCVGMAWLNVPVHRLTGVHMQLYRLTDWLGLIPLLTAAAFALLGLAQWVKRKKLRLVDRSLLVLGGFYAAVMAAYVLFEVLAVNCRPVLINGVLEVSYPSSTTLLVLCVMPTAAMQLRERMKNRTADMLFRRAIAAFSVFMVAARLVSGVHWFTDIVGGALLSAALVLAYRHFALSSGA